jgi:arsenate reductase
MQKRILFICIHNSARSQMAEALLRRECGDAVHVESAGLTPGTLNPLAVDVLKEIGIDISGKGTRDVFEVYKSGARFTHVITVCDQASAERCPVFPGVALKANWSFADPSQFTGTYEEKLEQTRAVRDAIEQKVHEWCSENCVVTT